MCHRNPLLSSPARHFFRHFRKTTPGIVSIAYASCRDANRPSHLLARNEHVLTRPSFLIGRTLSLVFDRNSHLFVVRIVINAHFHPVSTELGENGAGWLPEGKATLKLIRQ